jgi:hypothetical protein
MSKEKNQPNAFLANHEAVTNRFTALKRRQPLVPKTQEPLLNLKHNLTHALTHSNEKSSLVLQWLLEPTDLLQIIQSYQAECENILKSLNTTATAIRAKKPYDKAIAESNLKFMEDYLAVLEGYTETHQQNIQSHLTLADSFLNLQTLLFSPGILSANGESLLKQRIAALNQEIKAVAEELNTLKGCYERVPKLKEYESRKQQLDECLENLIQTEIGCRKKMEQITAEVSSIIRHKDMFTKTVAEELQDTHADYQESLNTLKRLHNSYEPSRKTSSTSPNIKTNVLNADFIDKTFQVDRAIPPISSKKTQVTDSFAQPENTATCNVKIRLESLTPPPQALAQTIHQLEKEVNALNNNLIKQKEQAEALKEELRLERVRLLREDAKTVEKLNKQHDRIKQAEATKNNLWVQQSQSLNTQYNKLSFTPSVEKALTAEQTKSFNAEVKKVKAAFNSASENVGNKIKTHTDHMESQGKAFSKSHNILKQSLSLQPFTPVAKRAKAIERLKEDLEKVKKPLANYKADVEKGLKEVNTNIKNANQFVLSNKVKTYARALSNNLLAQIQALEQTLKEKEIARVCKSAVVGFFNGISGWVSWRPDIVAKFEAFEKKQASLEAKKQSIEALNQKITNLLAKEQITRMGYSEVFNEYMTFAETSAQPLKANLCTLHTSNTTEDRALSALKTNQINELKRHHAFAQKGLQTLADITNLHSFNAVQTATKTMPKDNSAEDQILPIALLNEGASLTTVPAVMADAINNGSKTSIGIGNSNLNFWIAVLEALDANKVRILLDAVDDEGNTLLHWAIRAKQLNEVNYLLDKGAQADSRNYAGQSCLDVAKTTWYDEAFSCERSALQTAFNLGGDQNENVCKQIHVAVEAAQKVAMEAPRDVSREKQDASSFIKVLSPEIKHQDTIKVTSSKNLQL